MSGVIRHLVDEKPTDPCDPSGCLCVKGGDRKRGKKHPPGVHTDGWTLDPARITCPNCLEWMHA